MQRRFDLIIFDLDGTLIDNRAAIRENFNYALSTHGFPQLEDKRIDAMIGTPLIEMFERILPKQDTHLAPQLVDTYVRRYRQTSHVGTVVLEDVIPTLEQLREDGFKLAVATTKANNTVSPLLESVGLHRYFDLATGRRDGMRNKPYPDMLNYVMKELGVKSEESAMVGDTPVDVMTARNAGIYIIVVTSGVRLGITALDKILDAKPDAVINSLEHLRSYLYA